jgi:hypothetical protein
MVLFEVAPPTQVITSTTNKDRICHCHLIDSLTEHRWLHCPHKYLLAIDENTDPDIC